MENTVSIGLKREHASELIPAGDPFVYKPSKCSAAMRFRWHRVSWTRKRVAVSRLGHVERLLFRLNIPSWNQYQHPRTLFPRVSIGSPVNVRVIRNDPASPFQSLYSSPTVLPLFDNSALQEKNRLLVRFGILQWAPWILLPCRYTRRSKVPAGVISLRLLSLHFYFFLRLPLLTM